jgi:hypothetical protein
MDCFARVFFAHKSPPDPHLERLRQASGLHGISAHSRGSSRGGKWTLRCGWLAKLKLGGWRVAAWPFHELV